MQAPQDPFPPLVVNENAGRASLRPDAILPDAFEQWLQSYAARAEVHVVPPEHINDLVDELVHAGYERIVVGGGDGTLSHVAGRLVDRDVDLVPLPLGTHNHFAKDLNMPVDPRQWTELCASGKTVEVDVGAIDERMFLNNVSFGWYPTMLKLRERFDGERLLGSKRLASMAAALMTRLRFVRSMQIYWRAGGEHQHSGGLVTKAMLFSNNRYASTPLAPMSRDNLETGRLTLYALRDLSMAGVSRMIDCGLRGELQDCPGVEVVSANRFWIELNRHPGRMAVDGELLRARRCHNLRSLAGRLRVVAPG